MPNNSEAGHGYGTKERVAEATRSMAARAPASPGGGSGMAVDAQMDRIASQSTMYTSANPNDKDGRSTGTEVRDVIEGHRREMQLAGIARAAKRAQVTMDVPKEKRATVVGGTNGAPLAAMLTARNQRTGGPGGQSALTHDQGHRGRTGVSISTTGRSTATTRSANQDMRRNQTPRAAPRQKAMVAGGHHDVPLPPPRPRGTRTDNYPGRAPARSAPTPAR